VEGVKIYCMASKEVVVKLQLSSELRKEIEELKKLIRTLLQCIKADEKGGVKGKEAIVSKSFGNP